MKKIKIEDDNYPKILRKTHNPPKQLYLLGNAELLYTPAIAIIGSRTCTKYGKKISENFASSLSQYGITIVSGMAKGIDSFAHQGTLENGGNTIAVLPCGLNNIYPEENKELFEKIIKNDGLIISEYEENEIADYNKFLERNRIVSGLSIGVLVVEGGYRSGTSVTANLAKEQGKKVFCIPSSLENKKGITPNKLIKEGAFLVMQAEDIVMQYPEYGFKKQENNKRYIEEFVEEEYKEIYDVLKYEEKTHINEISRIVKQNINEVTYKLMMLELEEKIISLPGNNYIKIKR